MPVPDPPRDGGSANSSCFWYSLPVVPNAACSESGIDAEGVGVRVGVARPLGPAERDALPVPFLVFFGLARSGSGVRIWGFTVAASEGKRYAM